MKKTEIKKLYREAIKKWGLSLQLGMLMEECAELIQATNKVMRKDDEVSWLHLTQEIADVEIMIDQIKTVVTWQNVKKRVDIVKYDKLIRLKKTLEKK